MKCSNCGNEIKNGEKFCSTCGFHLKDDIKQNDNTQNNVVQKDSSDYSATIDKNIEKDINKARCRIGLKLALLIAFIAFFFPFCTISCANQKLVSPNGYELAGDWGLSQEQMSELDLTTGQIANGVIIFVLVLMVSAFFNDKFIFFNRCLTTVAIICLYAFKKSEKWNDLTDIGCSIEFHFGYWLALFMLILATTTFIWAVFVISKIENVMIPDNMCSFEKRERFREKLNVVLSLLGGIIIIIAICTNFGAIKSWPDIFYAEDKYQPDFDTLNQSGLTDQDYDLANLQTATKEEIDTFIKKENITEEIDDYIYGNEEIAITLNDEGCLDTLNISTEKYKWYGVRVGDLFPVEQAVEVFEQYGYGFITNYENQYFYAVMENSGTLSKDGMFRIEIDYTQNIQSIAYSSIGAEELWNSIIEDESDLSAGGMESIFETVPMNNDIPENEGYILPESSIRYLNKDEIQFLDGNSLRLARNEIYARHGRKYESEDLNQYFNNQSWYYGYLSADDFDDSVLNDFEKANLDLIKQVENARKNNEIPILTTDYIFKEFDVNGQSVWSRADNDIYMVPEMETSEGFSEFILFSREPNTYGYAMYCYCDVDKIETTGNGGLKCTGSVYDYHTEEKLGVVEVIWDSFETVDYAEVKVLEGNLKLTGSYQYYGLTD